MTRRRVLALVFALLQGTAMLDAAHADVHAPACSPTTPQAHAAFDPSRSERSFRGHLGGGDGITGGTFPPACGDGAACPAC